MPTPSATPHERGATEETSAGPERLGVGGLLRTRGYRRLLAVRFATQWGDGLFQAALGGAVLFNPEHQADPLAVAGGLAVLLLPYSLISPFAGALLDRWDRRQVLVVANLAKAALIPLVALVVLLGHQGLVFYVGALAVAGIGRFALAGLSVALPHVVERRYLVEANTFAATIGTGMSALGAASAIGLRHVFGQGNHGSAWTTLFAIVGAVLAAALTVGFARKRLGPDHTEAQRRSQRPSVVGTVARGFVDGARATAATPSIAASFFALGAHRLAFGISTLLTLLLYRYAFSDEGAMKAGLPGIGEAVAIAAAGLLTAAFVTPWLVHRFGRPAAVRISLVAATVTQAGIALFLSMPALLVGAFFIGLTGQVVKLCADWAVQSEADDAVLGRIFALYDPVFNMGYVAAVAAAALLSPPDGRAPLLLGAAAAVYLVGMAAHDLELRRRRLKPVGGGPGAQL